MERMMGRSLRLLNQLAGSKLLARLNVLEPLEGLLYRGSRAGVATAAELVRRMRPVVKMVAPERMRSGEPARPELFDLTLTESQELVRETVQRFARERLRPLALLSDEALAPPAGLLDEAHALGLTQLAVPEPLGGAGEQRSPVTNALVIEDLARGDAGLALAALAPAAFVNALVDHGTAAQQGAYLPVFAGETFYPAAVALLEPRPLFDPERLATSATPDGDGFVLRGEKSLVPLAADAELFLVLAQLGDTPQAFIVEKGARGLHVAPEPTMGLRAGRLGRLVLDGVRVPREARLGGDEGFDAAALIDLSRIAWGALTVGTCDAVLDYVKSYCKERIAFGEPIVHRQSVAFTIANIAIELEGLRLLVYRAASRAEQGRSFRREAALVRVQSASKAMQIATDGVQLLGGHGFIKEHPVELWYRQLRAIGIVEGALSV